MKNVNFPQNSIPRETIKKRIDDIFKILATGTKEQVKAAKKEIESLWHKDKKGAGFKKCYQIIKKTIDHFDQIKDAEHQAYVIQGMSLFYLIFADKYFDVLKDFNINSLQHHDGRVREAARKTGDWLYVSLTCRMDPFTLKENNLSDKQKKNQEIARRQFKHLLLELDDLLVKYDSQSKIQYIQDMPPSIEKSLQLFRSRLADASEYRDLLEQKPTVPIALKTKRKEIEEKLTGLLLKLEDDYWSVDTVKQKIYHEQGKEDFIDLISQLIHDEDIDKKQDDLNVIADAWNYFPHQSLDDFSPAELFHSY